MNISGGPDEVRALNKFQSRTDELKASIVECAPLVSNEDDPHKSVGIDKEVKFIYYALLFKQSLRMTGQACRAPGKANAVVARKAQPQRQEIIAVCAHSPIRTINRRGMDASRFVVK